MLCRYLGILLLGLSIANALPKDKAFAMASLNPIKATGEFQCENAPANVLDNDPSTFWSNQGKSKLTIDLGRSYSVGKVAIAFFKGEERVTTFKIELSQDGKTPIFKTKWLKSKGNTKALEPFKFKPHKARYVSYIGHPKGNTENKWHVITELTVHGVKDSGSNDLNPVVGIGADDEEESPPPLARDEFIKRLYQIEKDIKQLRLDSEKK